MPTYVIERTVPGAGQMDEVALASISASSNDVLRALGPDVRWDHSYVVDDQILCVYEATGEDIIREHGRCGGFPVDAIHEVRATIGPATAGGDADRTTMGNRFARALAAMDGTALKALLRPDVDFRAMTPNKFWESHDAEAVVDETLLGTWFEAERRITETLAVDTAVLGPMERVGYRFRVSRPDGEFTIEQQAYYVTDGDRISWLRIMCTGFMPLTEP